MVLNVWWLLVGCGGAPPQAPAVTAPSPPPVAAVAPTPTLAAFPTLRGAGIGSTLPQLEAALGPVQSVQQIPYEESQDMGTGPQQRAFWPGLEVGLSQPEGAAAPVAWTWTLSSDAFELTPPIAVGATEEALLAAFGPPSERRSDRGLETRIWMVQSGEGHFWAVLRDGRVVELRAAEDWS